MSRSVSAHAAAAVLLVLAAAAATLAATAAGRRGAHHPVARAAATSCFSTHQFDPGAVDEFIVCFTRNGNVVRYQTPQGSENLAGSTFGEGYRICDQTGGNDYYDYPGFSGGGFAASSITQPGGANTFPLTIARRTTDGVWKLSQSFAWNTVLDQVTITMKVTNLSAIGRNALLQRMADFDVDHTPTNDVFDRTRDSVYAHDAASSTAIMLRSLSPQTPHWTNVDNSGNLVDGCFGPSDGVPTPAGPGDEQGDVIHDLGKVGAGKSKTVVVEYERF